MGKAKKSNKQVNKAFYVCDGAKCICTGAVAPTPVILNVKSQSKFFVVGGKKLIATDKDTTPESLDFIQCKNCNSYKSYRIPGVCKTRPPAAGITWKDFYKDVTYTAQHMHPLVDKSTGTCNGCDGSGKSTPATITIKDHGQGGTGANKKPSNKKPLKLRKLSPLAEAAEVNEDGKNPPVVSGIVLQDGSGCNSNPALPIRSGGEHGQTTKVAVEVTKENTQLDFSATIKSGDATLTSWNYYAKNNGNDGPGFDDLQKELVEVGSTLSVPITAGFKGKYMVEAYGMASGEKSCCIVVEVKPNSVKPVTGLATGLKDVLMRFGSGFEFGPRGALGIVKDFLGGGSTLFWKITGGQNHVLYDSHSPQVGPSGLVAVSAFHTLSVTFRNAGKYTVTAYNKDTMDSEKSLTVNVVAQFKMFSLSHPDHIYLRANENTACTIPGFNVDKSLINLSNIDWRIFYNPSPEAVTTQFVGWLPATGMLGITDAQASRSSFYHGLSVTLSPAQVQALFPMQIVSVKGAYTLEAFAKSDAAYNNLETQKFHFVVTNNRLLGGPPKGPSQVPQGATASYTVETIMPTIEDEKKSFTWTVEGGNYKFDGNNYEQAVKINFADNAAYTIRCSMTVHSTTSICAELHIQAAPLTLVDAGWCYDDGYPRTQTGYAEDCYAYLELGGITQLSGKLQVWAIDGDNVADLETAISDSAKKYLLAEYPVALTADANKQPPTAHGQATLKLDKAADKQKLQTMFPPPATSDGSIQQNIKFGYTVTLQSSGDSIKLGTNTPITGATTVTVGGVTYYKPLPADGSKLLALDYKQRIKALYFTDDKKKKQQNGATWYGKSHAIRIHTINLAGEKLTVRLYCETPNAVLDGTYDATNKSIVIAEQFQEFADQTVGDDGTLDVDFTLKKPEWYDKHPETLPYKMFVAEVLKKTKDANNNDVLQLVQSQYNTNEMLPFTIIRNDDNQIGIKILSDEAAADNESLKQYKQQYLHANDALFVVREEAKKLDVQPSPTIVHFEDIEVVSKKDCFCNRDFMVDDVKKMLLTVHGATKLWKLGKIPEADRSFEKLTYELNAMFRKYDINRCMQKICFLAQVDAETGFFQESEEAAGKDASSQSVYKGRGIIQLTGSRNDGEELYNHPGDYQRYADYVGKQDIVINPSQIATNLHLCVDSSGWEWAIGNTIPNWDESTPAKKWKHEHFFKALTLSLNKVAKLAEVQADEDKYFFLVSKRLNGYPPDQTTKPPNGWPARLSTFYKLRNDFFEYDERHNGIEPTLDAPGKAPWLVIALQEFNKYKICMEGDSPLKEKVSVYFNATGYESDYQDKWCAAFIAWCFKQTVGYKDKLPKNSAGAKNWYASNWDKGEDTVPFVGAIMVFSFSHVAILVGESVDGKRYKYLGGNQGDAITIHDLPKTDSRFKFSKPKGYDPSEVERKLPKITGTSIGDTYETTR